MTEAELNQTLQQLISAWEGECVEFKDANDNFSTSEIGKYFSALSNEANLRNIPSAWLVFGVSNGTRSIIGTTYRDNRERLDSLKQQIAQDSDPSISFREIHELKTPQGRIILFQIPSAPRGIPIAWKTHFYARNGESLTGLDLTKLEELRAQPREGDWTASTCDGATLGDLDPAALLKAREIFIGKFRDSIPEETIRSWDEITFLDKAKITIQGKITRTCLLLLGRSESTHFLSPSVAELSWKLEGPERDYQHFSPPFLLGTSLLYQRIRNLRLTLLPPGSLLPIEISKYDQRVVLEALHNCIAHQDYTKNERVLVIERPSELIFQNAGEFFDGTPTDYILGTRSPRRYRNRHLAQAMVHLRMIDTMGFGIRDVMWKGQASRYLPLPDFDLSEPGHVTLRLQGRFIDENYSRTLLSHADLPWPDVLALDAVQKGALPDDESIQSLRKQGLIEGRKPHFHVAAEIAAVTDKKSEYIRHKAFDDTHFCEMILAFLTQFGEGRREDFERLLDGKLSDLLTSDQKKSKIHNLLQKLKRKNRIKTEGKTSGSVWKLVINNQL
ncbi:MAG: putative DNA binding domain-containing protein [Verrucomicrobia bacterium]|nr:putative DNA binding domain-containing protein [Verrucomicrobiota bacterium]